MSKKLLLFTPLCALLLSYTSALAQSYVSVAPGSKYICGYMPDGTNLIFRDKGSDRQLVSPKKAVAKLKGEIDGIRNRIETLKEIRASLRDDQLTASDLQTLKKIYINGRTDTAPLPKGKAERKAAINQLISNLTLQVRNKRVEITAIRDCSDGKRPEPTGGVQYEVVKFKAADGVYIALIMYVPSVSRNVTYLQRSYCVRAGSEPSGSRGAPYLFTKNPCFDGVPPFSGNNCASLAKGMLADFFAFRIFQGPSWTLDSPYVLNAENEFREKYIAGVVGRVRGATGLPTDPATAKDDCSVIP